MSQGPATACSEIHIFSHFFFSPDLLVPAAGKVRLDADKVAFVGLFLSRFLRFPLLPYLPVTTAVPKKSSMRMVKMPLIPEYW